MPWLQLIKFPQMQHLVLSHVARLRDSLLIVPIGTIAPRTSCAAGPTAWGKSGPDGVPFTLLKTCSRELCQPIKVIWAESFAKKEIPSFYKQTCISPIYKVVRGVYKGRPPKSRIFKPPPSPCPGVSEFPKPPPLPGRPRPGIFH